MALKNIKISPNVSIFGIVLFYLLLSGVMMLILFKLENYSFKYVIGFLEILLFAIITYFINIYYFKKINLKPPTLIGINTTLFTGLLIGILFALIENFPYRIYALFRTGNFEYLFLAFGAENLIKALGSGMFEEITFRGTLLNFYNQKNKKYLGLVISSLIFGLIHISNAYVGTEVSIIYIIYLIIAGLCFGLIYLNFGIVASITTHVMSNLLISSFIQPTKYGFYYILGIDIVICVWLFFRDKRKNVNKSTKANNAYN